MNISIPIPDGLKLPQNAESEPFTAEVEFLAMDGMLMPVSVAGMPIASEEPEMEEEGYEEGGEMEEGAEGEAEMEEGEEGGKMCEQCGGDKAKCNCGKMRGGVEPEGGGFMIAIERALAQPKR